MIAVIADDITGAAEIAALGWRRGLSAQVQTTSTPRANADLIVIDTDTRSSAKDTARNIVNDLADRLRALPVQWYFKKVDSVLRGNVGAELEALMTALGKTRTILAPANPSKGRVIVDGRYLIERAPLDETEFAHDPEHPARSSFVPDLLDVSPVCSLHVLERAAYTGRETGIVVPQAKTAADLSEWAAHLHEHTLAAGGADFFEAILARHLPAGCATSREPVTPLQGPKLFVCGSRSETSRRAVVEASRLGIRVCPMPEALFQESPGDEALIRQWADDIMAALVTRGCAVVTIGQPERRNATSALDVRTRMTALVQQVVDGTRIREMFIEGGATADAILHRLEWDTLDVVGEYGPGVVRLAANGLPEMTVTLKPGSYPWPEGMWTLM